MAQRHAIEDATADHERPKAIRYASHLFLTAYTVGYDPATTSLSTLGAMITSIFETNMSLADTRMNTIMKKL